MQKSYGVDDFETLSLLEGMPNQFLKDMQQATADELFEFLKEFSWKPWASERYLNRDAAIGELVDALHFIALCLASLRCDDVELSQKYRAKMERNRLRQISGYTGLNKCDGCGRDWDDIKAYNPDDYVTSIHKVEPNQTKRYCGACVRERGIT